MFVLNPESSTQELRLQDSFTQLATHLVQLLNTAGLTKIAYLNGLPHFNELTLSEKNTAVEHLKFYRDLCFDHVTEGQSLRDSKRLTWRALVKLGLSPGSDFLNRIECGDVVEIYNTEQVQLFRNLEFFDICSYSIEELFCVPWWRLFNRDTAVSTAIIRLVEDLYQRKFPDGISSPLPRHLVVEALSEDQFNIDFFMKYIGPLYQNKQIAALVCIEQAQLT